MIIYLDPVLRRKLKRHSPTWVGARPCTRQGFPRPNVAEWASRLRRHFSPFTSILIAVSIVSVALSVLAYYRKAWPLAIAYFLKNLRGVRTFLPRLKLAHYGGAITQRILDYYSQIEPLVKAKVFSSALRMPGSNPIRNSQVPVFEYSLRFLFRLSRREQI